MKKQDRDKLILNVVKGLLGVLFVTFVTLYFSGATGYYEYDVHKKMSLTEEQIKKFEADVAAGKNVSVEDYISNTNHDYHNNTSRFGLKISQTIGKYMKMGVEEGFKLLNRLVEG